MVETSLSQLALFDFIVTFSLYGNHRVLFGRACWFLAGAQVAVLPARLPQRAAWAGCAIGRLVCNASLGHVNAQMGRYDRHVRRIRPTPDSLTTFPGMRAGCHDAPTVKGRVPVGARFPQEGAGLCRVSGCVQIWDRKKGGGPRRLRPRVWQTEPRLPGAPARVAWQSAKRLTTLDNLALVMLRCYAEIHSRLGNSQHH